jgi:UPF0176 protein
MTKSITQSDFTVLLYYKFTHFPEPETIRDQVRAKSQELGLTGRIIVAEEGINTTVEGTTENIQKFMEFTKSLPGCADTHFKLSPGTGQSFPKLSVKARKEIVTLRLGPDSIDPNKLTGKYITAEELHQLFHSDEEFYIIDMRNDYEHSVGYFQNSILPPLRNFRDLPKILPSIEHLKHKKVITVCTGGIRCEKASGFLLKHGFTDVYQLWGGIVTYMEKYPNQHFLGKLYVFDGRVVMGFNTDSPEHQVVGKCKLCGKTCESFVNCANDDCHLHFICCADCQRKSAAKFRYVNLPAHTSKVFCCQSCEEAVLSKNYK